MAISHFFDGKSIKLPGAYAATTANIPEISLEAAYRKVLIIDTGAFKEKDPSAVFARGAGIAGEFSQGRNSLYELNTSREMKDFVKSGYWYVLSNALFNPTRGLQGVTQVNFISACSTIAARCNIQFGSLATVEIACKDEGLFGNAHGKLTVPKLIGDSAEFEMADSTDTLETLRRGYAVKVEESGGKYKLKFYVGTWTGKYFDGKNLIEGEYGVLTNCEPSLVCESDSFESLDELEKWFNESPEFNMGFKFMNTSALPSTILTATNAPDLDVFLPFTEGKEQYDIKYIDDIIEATKGIDTTFVITDRYGTMDGYGLRNNMICASVLNQRFKQFLVVGGGDTRSEFNRQLMGGRMSSTQMAEAYNSDFVWVVHGGIKLKETTVREWDSLYTVCYVVGRIAATEPQVPATFKGIDVQGLTHELTDMEKEEALDKGVLAVFYDTDTKSNVILKGINTLQNNNRLVNPNGTSCSIAVRRVTALVEKEMIIDAKTELFTDNRGITIMSLPAALVKIWVEKKLDEKINRQLIYARESVSVERRQDAYFVTYGIRLNYEINFIFFNSVILD
jgi:hypothetical protein